MRRWLFGTFVPPIKEVVPLSPVFVYIFIAMLQKLKRMDQYAVTKLDD
jgi:hypothetical protein